MNLNATNFDVWIVLGADPNILGRLSENGESYERWQLALNEFRRNSDGDIEIIFCGGCFDKKQQKLPLGTIMFRCFGKEVNWQNCIFSEGFSVTTLDNFSQAFTIFAKKIVNAKNLIVFTSRYHVPRSALACRITTGRWQKFCTIKPWYKYLSIRRIVVECMGIITTLLCLPEYVMRRRRILSVL